MSDEAAGRAPKMPAIAPNSLRPAEIQTIAGISIHGSVSFSALIGTTTLALPHPGCLIFLDAYREDAVAALNQIEDGSILVAAPDGYRGKLKQPMLITAEPRAVFTRLVSEMFDYYGSYWRDFDGHEAAQARNPGATVLPGAFVHRTAKIGADSMIFPGVVVGPRVVLGDRAMVKPNAMIGFPGFGIFRTSTGTNVHLPHVGGVVIGNDVEVGAAVTICAGTIHPTIVADRVKLDDHVHIAHNCEVASNVQMMAHAEVSGSVTIGRNASLSPNCSVANGTTIGDDVIVGIAANVVKNVPAGVVVVGNPARAIRSISADERAVPGKGEHGSDKGKPDGAAA